MKSKTATQAAAGSAKPKAKACSCGQTGSGGSGCNCCQPVCFERPKYFCGQLLNDDDLTAEQTYLREKQKLYHRTLHGYGIVCGLRLTCDTDCREHVRIGDGYAIDDCGNDIVVCESTSFDVIAALKEKNLLVVDSPWNSCNGEEPPRCKIKQCFYVTICYDEEQADFTAPFKTSCGPGAAACEPTRIKETFRFDVLESPPKPRNYLDEIEERIACCWKIFTDGPLARALKDYFNTDAVRENQDRDYSQIFCQLKLLFQHHLKKCPDLYDCTLSEQLCNLECPKDEPRNYERHRDPLCKLFGLIQRYAYDCILGEMIFACPNPLKSNCVGLGSIEVEDGKLLRVCNCPRTYVWTFANFFEVLLATVVGGAACTPHDEDNGPRKEIPDATAREMPSRKHEHEGCCTSFEFDCGQFEDLFRVTPHFGRMAAASPVRAIRDLIESLRTAFRFTDSRAFSSEIFKGMSGDAAVKLAEKLAGGNRNGSPLKLADPSPYEALDPMAAVFRNMLVQPGNPLVATQSGDDKKNVAAVVRRSQIPEPIMNPPDWEDRIKTAEDKAASAVSELTKQVTAIQEQISRLTASQPQQVPSTNSPPATPPK
ncbi:MAG TPA: hypothetical protein VHR66_25695 [Gemmataceae bacterium]|jgi:hypothetical protein|nr:hypothetical protein [Gemmataceae bacterium]